MPLNTSCMLRVYFKLSKDLTAGCEIAINSNAACHLSKMKYSASDFWMVMINLILPVPPFFLSLFLSLFLIFIMQVNLKNEKQIFWPSFTEHVSFWIHSQLLNIWPCKTHSSVIMFSKCFCYKSFETQPADVSQSVLSPLYHIMIHFSIWAGYMSLSVTFFSVFLLWFVYLFVLLG